MKKYKLGEIIEVTRGASLCGNYYATSGKYIRLTCGHFDYRNNCFKENTSKDNLYYTGDFRAVFLLEKGDLITPLTEQAIGLLGSTAWIPESGKYIQSQDIAKITCKEELLDKKFAYYLISSNMVKQQLSAAAQQTKIRHTSPDKIKDCTVWLPSLAEQKQIGQLLSYIDHKIALNRSINHNLEAMAKQLYDYWFLQFDFPDENGMPYKSSGGKMVWNEKLKREIPEGWKVGKVKDFLRIFTGKKDVSKSTPGKYKFFSCAPESITSNEYIHDGEAVLVSGNGSYTGRVSYYNGKFDLYQRTYACVPIKDDSKVVFFYYTLRYLFQPVFTGGKRGSSIPYIVLGDLADFKFAYNEQQTQKFVKLVSPIFDLQFDNRTEDEGITMLRDSLLPLLMNGQVEIDVERFRLNYDLAVRIVRKSA